MALIEQLALQVASRISQPLAEVRAALDKLLEHATLEQVCGWRPSQAGGIPWILITEIQKFMNAPPVLRCRISRVRGRLVLELDVRKTDGYLSTATPALGAAPSSLLLLELTSPVSSLLTALNAVALEDASGQVITATNTLLRSVAPGIAIRRSDDTRCILQISAGPGCAVVWQWCTSRGLGAHAATLLHSALDDLFVLPLLTSVAHLPPTLPPSTHSPLLAALADLRELDAYASVAAWVTAAGFSDAASALAAARVDMQAARLLNTNDLTELGISAARASSLCSLLQSYTLCSSVDEAHRWLHARGFGMYAFHFTRYNIPFYALPYVNMFILEEMGVARDDGLPLLEALHGLRQEPAYEARALAFWLRDLELERHAPALARAGCSTLAALAALPASDFPKLVPVPADATKLAAALDELREFQSYYSATGTLLQQLGLGKFASLMAHHAISVDVLALLTPDHLQHVLGITSASDRQLLLAALQAVRHELPTRVTDLFGAADQQPQQQYPQHYASASRQPAARANNGARPQEDPRSLEELLSFIKGEHNSAPASSAASKRKPKEKEKTRTAAAGSRVTAHVRGELTPKRQPRAQPGVTQQQQSAPPAPSSASSKATRVVSVAPAPVAVEPTPVPPVANKHFPGPAAEPLDSQWTEEKPAPEEPEQLATDDAGPSALPEPSFEDEEELDAEQEAALEREVEAFRQRLEQAHAIPLRRPSVVFSGTL